MSKPLEDYALIGDCRTAALIARDGSIDWLCLPLFESNACFTALLGGEEHGCWRFSTTKPLRQSRRRYRPGTLILESEWETDSGAIRLIEFMPPGGETPTVVRIIEGVRGEVELAMQLIVGMDYGSVAPWIREVDGGFVAIGGPERFHVTADVKLEMNDRKIVSQFQVRAGETHSFLFWCKPSYSPIEKEGIDPREALEKTERWWSNWCSGCHYDGEFADEVKRSLITLKALTDDLTGGIIAAVTTSLPEDIGGVRNWDYRYCWVRDSSLILQALLRTGYSDEARRWYDWLMRSVGGDPAQVQVMYGVTGERRLVESELPWLPGYENSRPVRVGNHAFEQRQLDVYGEIATCFYLIREAGLPTTDFEWEFILGMMKFLETGWREKDESIWEVREKQDHFTYSKFMCWVAFDRAIQAAEKFRLPAPVEEWRLIRKAIHDDVCRNGFNPKIGAFVQAYGSEFLDASVLRMPLEGFLPPDDPRLVGTVAAIEEHLISERFVFRYYPSEKVDGLPGAEGAFLMCSFWLVDTYLMMGREKDARRLYGELLTLLNDVGLLSEEYDPDQRRLIGNFPQGLSHTGLIISAHCLSNRNGSWRL